jgi:hypothetical protein
LTCSKRGLKVLILCTFVFGLTAVWSGAAQAEETGGSWKYELGGVVKTFEGALSEPTVSGEMTTGTVGVSHTTIFGTSILFECKGILFEEVELTPATPYVKVKLKFDKCGVFFNKVESKNCTPNALGKSPGTIETKKLKANLLLHKLANGTVDKILIAEPLEGTTLAFLESTEACSLGEKVPIGGKVAIIDSEPTTLKVRHLFKEFEPLTHMYVISDTAEHAAHMLGSAEAFLSGAHLNYKWAGAWK